MKKLLLCLALLPLSACGQKTDQPAEVEKLIKKTFDNMVYVEGGSFIMGDVGYEVPESDPDGQWITMEDGHKSYRKPFGCDEDCKFPHKVTLTGYYINKYEMIYTDYDTYTNANRLPLVKAERRGKSRFVKEDLSVNLGVDWYGAQNYCQWLGKVTGLPFDLPTEAQWEYAARSRGLPVLFATDNGKLEPGRNYRPHHSGLPPDPPGLYPPNPLGLYDMTGNVNEWVRDWYNPYYYEKSPELNPQGPAEDDIYTIQKTSRGFGRAHSDWSTIWVIRRIADDPDNAGNGNGFRCAINSDQPLPKLSQLPVVKK